MDKVDVLMHISGHGESELCEWANDNLQELAWSKCSDKMPAEQKRVLCLLKGGGMKILRYEPSWAGRHTHDQSWAGETVSGIGQRMDFKSVTHWMPLPDVPEGWGQIATTPNANSA